MKVFLLPLILSAVCTGMDDKPCRKECGVELKQCIAMGMKTEEEVKACVFGKIMEADSPTTCSLCVASMNNGEDDREEPIGYEDCAEEYESCIEMGVEEEDDDAMYMCLITQSWSTNNRRCAGFLTLLEEGEGDARIGMGCLEDIALCTLVEGTAEAVFAECLIPAVRTRTVSADCLKAFDEMIAEGGMQEDDHMALLESTAIRACATEAGICMSLLGIDVEDISDEQESQLKMCVQDKDLKATSEECSNAIKNVLAAYECRETNPMETETDAGLMACIEKGGTGEVGNVDDVFVKNYTGEFFEFFTYCSRQRGQAGCAACSGDFENGACTAPSSANKVKCHNIVSMDVCEAIGCTANRGRDVCRGKNHWRN